MLRVAVDKFVPSPKWPRKIYSSYNRLLLTVFAELLDIIKCLRDTDNLMSLLLANIISAKSLVNNTIKIFLDYCEQMV